MSLSTVVLLEELGSTGEIPGDYFSDCRLIFRDHFGVLPNVNGRVCWLLSTIRLLQRVLTISDVSRTISKSRPVAGYFQEQVHLPSVVSPVQDQVQSISTFETVQNQVDLPSVVSPVLNAFMKNNPLVECALACSDVIR